MNVRYPGPPPLEAAGREIDRLKKLVDTLNHRLGQKDTVPLSEHEALAAKYIYVVDKYSRLVDKYSRLVDKYKRALQASAESRAVADHTRRERDYWYGRVRDLEASAAKARIADVTKFLDD
jgi:hypothetical protein